jgi:P4 family phage/plasmid primase-like protien
MSTDATQQPADIEAAVETALEFLRIIAAPTDWIEMRLLPLSSSRWFQLIDDGKARSMLRYAMRRNRQAESPDNVYVGINPRTGYGKRGDRNVAVFRSLFADFDNGITVDEALHRIRAAGLPDPTLVIVSGGGVHVYWMLDEATTDAADWKARMAGIIHAVNSDKSIRNPERIMRLPGSDNVKPGRDGRPACRIVEHNGGRHPITAFPAHVGSLERIAAAGMPKRPSRRLGDEAETYLRTGKVGPERRPAIFNIACDMKARGWPLSCANEAIMSRVHDIQPPLSDDDIDDLERQIANAYSVDRVPGYESTPSQKAAQAVVASATGDEPHSGGLDLTRAHTLTDIGAARRLGRIMRGRVAWVRERGMWSAWDGRRYIDNSEHVVVQYAKRQHDELWGELGELDAVERTAAVVKFVQESGHSARINACVGLAKSEPGINVSQSDFDTHAWLLNVENGVVDLRTGDLLPHDPKYMITQMAAVTYDPTARSSLWEKFIDDVTCGNTELVEFLQQACGIALTGDVSDEVLVCHQGGGCNGKSTFLEALAGMMGDYAASAPPGLFTVRKHESHPTELALLHGKRLVTAIEQEANRALRESLVKTLTGGDTITCRRMREDFWQMKPTWHIHIAYNAEPRLTGTDDGIRRRLAVVKWEASFKGAPDLTMKERLTGPSERSAILNWCIAGLRKRIAAGRLHLPDDVRNATADYIDDEDLIGRFLAERTEADAGPGVELRTLLQALRAFLEADGTPRYIVDTFTANAVARELRRRGYRKVRPDSGMYRKQTMITGIRLVDTLIDGGAIDEEWATFHR